MTGKNGILSYIGAGFSSNVNKGLCASLFFLKVNNGPHYATCLASHLHLQRAAEATRRVASARVSFGWDKSLACRRHREA